MMITLMKVDIMKKALMMLVVILFFPCIVIAFLTEDQKNKFTEEMQKHDSKWTAEQTNKKIEEMRNSSSYTGLHKGISIDRRGNTVLVNGRDITGNLGSKTTYGRNSPIMEDVKDSQVAIGDESRVEKDTQTTSFSITIPLSVSLCSLGINVISVPFSIYFLLAKVKENGCSL